MEELRDWLLDLNGFSALGGTLFFLFSRKKFTSVSGVIFLILLFSFLADNLNYFFIRLIYPNSFIIGNIWIIVNYLLMIWLFRKILVESSKTILRPLAAVFITGTSVSFFFFKITEANTFISLYSDLSFIFLSLLTYLQLLRNPSHKLTIQPIFWIATSFFVHSSLILLQSVFDNYLIFDQNITPEGYVIIHIINLVANTTKNFILFYALVLINRGFPDKIEAAKKT